MKITSPLNESCCLPLLAKEADEFYVGIVEKEPEACRIPPLYNTRGGRSGPANFRDWKSLEKAVKEASVWNRPIYLTMNAHNIDPDRENVWKRILDRFVQIGGTGVISANLDCLRYGKEIGLKCSVSTIMGLYNVEAIRWIVQEIRPERIVLSRDLTLEEIKEIRRETGVALEVFGMNFGCRYSNAFCFGSHNHATKGFCHAVGQMEWEYRNRNGEPMSGDFLLKADLNHWLYTNALLESACGACAVYSLIEMGIDHIKIVGRELDGDKILESAVIMRRCIEAAENSQTVQEYWSKLPRKNIQKNRYGCYGGYQCYYPESCPELNEKPADRDKGSECLG